MIRGEALFSYIEGGAADLVGLQEDALEHIVYKSSSIKARIVEKDELDRKGMRVVLNYGHTIGHAIETASGYSRSYTHGEAIAVGMVTANKIAERLGMLDRDTGARIEGLLRRVGLPTAIKGVSLKRVYESHLHDKKFSGPINRFVLPAGIGDVRVVSGIKETIIKKVLEDCYKR